MISSLKGLLSLGGLTPKELAARVWRAMVEDDIINRAAIPGFFMLALFPLLLCLTALCALEMTVKLADGRTFDAKLIFSDPSSDLAVLKIEANDPPTLPPGDFADSSPEDE